MRQTPPAISATPSATWGAMKAQVKQNLRNAASIPMWLNMRQTIWVLRRYVKLLAPRCGRTEIAMITLSSGSSDTGAFVRVTPFQSVRMDSGALTKICQRREIDSRRQVGLYSEATKRLDYALGVSRGVYLL